MGITRRHLLFASGMVALFQTRVLAFGRSAPPLQGEMGLGVARRKFGRRRRPNCASRALAASARQGVEQNCNRNDRARSR